MSDGIWLITSAAFVDQELAAEFGKLPPAFLPVGTRRLYEYQVERLGKACPVYLTLPDSFTVPPHDAARLDALGVTILHIPEGLSLGEAVVFALNLVSGPDVPLRILHGDTLIDRLPENGLNEIGVSAGGEGYSWAEVRLTGTQITGIETVAAGMPAERGLSVVCGYFAFASSAALVRAMTRSRGDFIQGVAAYGAHTPLSAVQIDSWYDFGHLQTYFRSRRVVTTVRAFNNLLVDGRTARKSSEDTAKMQAEAHWLATVPPAIRIYTARLIDSGEENGRAYYETAYEYLPTLSELFVFGTLSRPRWTKILQSCEDYLTASSAHRGPARAAEALRSLVPTKTVSRLKHYANATGFNIDAMLRYAGRPLPSLMQIAADLQNYIDLSDDRSETVMHGDFCFSNILYDSRIQRIRVIDPRGYVQTGTPTIFGDVRYDLAKFAHSIAGRYDQIIAGRYTLSGDNGYSFGIAFEPAPHHAWLEAALGDFGVGAIRGNAPDVQAVTISLFLSMLPLHADRPDRQRAFIANALRLYAGLEFSNR